MVYVVITTYPEAEPVPGRVSVTSASISKKVTASLTIPDGLVHELPWTCPLMEFAGDESHVSTMHV
jgi:hypothetical protein